MSILKDLHSASIMLDSVHPALARELARAAGLASDLGWDAVRAAEHLTTLAAAAERRGETGKAAALRRLAEQQSNMARLLAGL